MMMMRHLTVLCALITTIVGEECVQGENCKLPDCFCPTYKHFLGSKNIPQIVYFGYDDAVQPQVSAFYDEIFTEDKVNPNGCPITMSLYISHDNTVYDLVSHFYKRNDEAAVHSVTHTDINTADKLRKEATEQKENIEKMAQVPAKKIIGWRSPNLLTAGDDQPKVLKELNFTYDISLTYDRDMNYPFPFTLDYGFPYPCKIQPCPKPSSKHEGFWEVMVNSLRDPTTGFPCTYIDSCRPDGEEAALDYLWSNFLTTYENQRAPFGLNMHAAWYFFPGYLPATISFIKLILQKPDVYIVSVEQMIEWMKNPVNLTEIKYFEPWGCDKTRHTTRRTTTTMTTHKPMTSRPQKSVMPKTKRPVHPLQVITKNPHQNNNNNVRPHVNETPFDNWYRNNVRTTRAPLIRPTPVKTQGRFGNGIGRPISWYQQTPSHCVQGINCNLPSCLCKTTFPPFGLSRNDIPQIIYLAIDSQIDGRTFSSLMQLFSGSLKNENGCPITGTMFIQPDRNYPPYVNVLKQHGVHVALKSRFYPEYMSHNFVRMAIAQELSKTSSLLSSSLLSPKLGWRTLGYVSPSDSVFKTLHEKGVVFDSSVINNSTQMSWPYSLDFGASNTCPSTLSRCFRYPGMWEVPLEQLIIPGTSRTCVFLDSCSSIPSRYTTEQLLMYNFHRHYNYGKVPFGINLRSQWLLTNRHEGIRDLSRFIDKVTKTRNAVVVSIDRLLQWMTSPVRSINTLIGC